MFTGILSVSDFVVSLSDMKNSIEAIKDENKNNGMKLSFVGKSGKKIEKVYSHADEGTGVVLKNILEDTLDEYDDFDKIFSDKFNLQKSNCSLKSFIIF